MLPLPTIPLRCYLWKECGTRWDRCGEAYRVAERSFREQSRLWTIVYILWRGTKCVQLLCTFLSSVKCAQLLCTIKPEGSLGSCRIWDWMGSTKGRILSGVFRCWIATCNSDECTVRSSSFFDFLIFKTLYSPILFLLSVASRDWIQERRLG